VYIPCCTNLVFGSLRIIRLFADESSDADAKSFERWHKITWTTSQLNFHRNSANTLLSRFEVKLTYTSTKIAHTSVKTFIIHKARFNNSSQRRMVITAEKNTRRKKKLDKTFRHLSTSWSCDHKGIQIDFFFFFFLLSSRLSYPFASPLLFCSDNLMSVIATCGHLPDKFLNRKRKGQLLFKSMSSLTTTSWRQYVCCLNSHRLLSDSAWQQ